MEEKDDRWRQRFRNYEKAYQQLEKAIPVFRKDPENFVLQAGLIQIYKFTFELAWKTLKDFLESEGFMVASPKSTIRQAYASGYIHEGDLWIKALNDRNLTTHTYEEHIVAEVLEAIQEKYFFLLKDLYEWLKARQ